MQPHPREKRGILGGSFDPIHWGHLGIAYTALAQAQLDQVIWVSDRLKGDPRKQCSVDFEHRQEMVRLAIAPETAFCLGPEPAPKARYAIDTLQTLQALYPPTQWYWIIGADAFSTLPKWYRAGELAEACEWLVAPRLASLTGADHLKETPFSREVSPLNFQERVPELASAVGTNSLNHKDDPELRKTEEICQKVAIALASQQVTLRWQILESKTLAIASTLVRRHWCDWPKIRTWVPEAVQIYIQTHHLYQNPAHPLPPHSTSIPRL